MSQGGFIIGSKINDYINVALGAGCGMIFEKKSSMNFFVFDLGVFIYL
jgi:hypothetical protein